MSVSEILMASQLVREAPALLTIVAKAVHEEPPHFVHFTCLLPPERSSNRFNKFPPPKENTLVRCTKSETLGIVPTAPQSASEKEAEIVLVERYTDGFPAPSAKEPTILLLLSVVKLAAQSVFAPFAILTSSITLLHAMLVP